MRIFAFLVMALLATAGCIDADSSDEPAETDSTDEGTADAQAPVAVAAPPPCNTASNYGLYVEIEDEIIYSGPGGLEDMRVYRDDNGMAGLQTEESCPDDHDTRVA